ncbi:DUF3280 domain-containing protein [Hyphomicrobium sp. ghe19]|uniref:DUF3280 domain-containing protein n=1 Tax=Hyphomicrobium sp. ghe19 TaxID=2682968 RepID=UPI001366C9F3|nr:hypothetical protein HYPP_00904 [Hyphomicrobium sp. ghe19]
MIERRRIFLLPLILATLLLQVPCIQQAGASPSPPRLAFLGLRLQNDNEVLEPTTEAERNRISIIEKQFTSSLEAARSYSIVPLTNDIRAKIASGQFVGSCGGCEAEFGKELKADRVAWITVQKVSNLILNMNLYMADPATDKMTFLKSVDIRGNTDESWSRSLKYLLDNYFYDKKS